MKQTLLFILALLFTSCVSYYEATDIGILVSPTYQLPPEIDDIYIINNAKKNTPGVHTTQNINLENNRSYKVSDDTIEIDSATSTFLSNLESQANVFPVFNSIKIAPPDFSQNLKTSTCDALIVLEDFQFSTTLSKIFYGIYDSRKSEVRVITKSRWNIYYAKEENKQHPFTISDTLYWSHKNIDRVDCIHQSFWSHATKASQEFIPYWKDAQRLYHSNIFHTLSLAEDKVKTDDWESAAEIWMTMYNQQTRDSKLKGKMAFNMALYFETTNNIEGAKEWLTSAKRIFTKKKMKEEVQLCIIYRNILDTRAKKNKELDKYFNR